LLENEWQDSAPRSWKKREIAAILLLTIFVQIEHALCLPGGRVFLKKSNNCFNLKVAVVMKIACRYARQFSRQSFTSLRFVQDATSG
jgi:hypothetical protein